MNSPLVSVVVPSFNHSRYIESCIRSIINQDYKNIELIIIDDGSIDSSVEVIESFDSENRRRFNRYHFIARDNRGLASTLNEALEWCSGEYIVFIASDDMMLPHRIRSQVEHFDTLGSSCAGIFGSSVIINDNGETVGELKVKNRLYDFLDIYFHRHNLPACTQMLRTHAVRQVGGFPVGYVIEDWFMWLSLTKQGYYLYAYEENLSSYRIHKRNTSSNVELMHRERLRILELYSNQFNSNTNNIARACCYLSTSLQYEALDKKWVYIFKSIRITPRVLFERKFYIAVKRALL